MKIVAMSQIPDSVSQFVNGFNISGSLFEKDGLAVDSVEPVSPTGFSEIARRVTLLAIYLEPKELAERSEEVKNLGRYNDVISMHGNRVRNLIDIMSI